MNDFGNMIAAYGMPPEPTSPRIAPRLPNPLDNVQVVGPPFPNNVTLTTVTTAAQAIQAMENRAAWLRAQLAQADAWLEELKLLECVLQAASKHRSTDLQGEESKP